jgi:hypothetical protein
VSLVLWTKPLAAVVVKSYSLAHLTVTLKVQMIFLSNKPLVQVFVPQSDVWACIFI